MLAIAEHPGQAGDALRSVGATHEQLLKALTEVRGSHRVTDENPEEKYRALERYGRDLTEAAAQGKLDPVIGRDDEIRRVDPGPLEAHQEQPGADRRARRRQDRDRRGPRAADRVRRRAREPQGPPPGRARPERDGRRVQVPRRVRGPAQGRAQGDRRRQGPDHRVHRRAPHDRRRRRRRGRDGRRQHAQADARPRRAAGGRRDHARRVPQAHREGPRARAPLPARVRGRADRRGHDRDPPRAQGALPGPPQDPHPGLRAGGGGDAEPALHRRPVPARQGDRPGRRGRVADPDGDRLQADRDRRGRPAHHAARDRAPVAGRRRRSGHGGAARAARARARRGARALRRDARRVAAREGVRRRRGRASGAARAGQDRPRARPARGRPRARGRAPVRDDPRAREAAGSGGRSRARRSERSRGGWAPISQGCGRRRGRRRGRRQVDRDPGLAPDGGRDREARAHGGAPARAGDRPGRARRGGVERAAALARRPPGPRPADRHVPVHRTDRRRQDRAGARARRVHVRQPGRDGPDRHVRVHGEARGLAPGRRAARIRRLRRGRPADRGGPPPSLLAWCCSTRSRRPTPTCSTRCCR